MCGIPSSHLEREENRERFWKRGPHRKISEGDVLRPSQKRERFLAEDVQTANLSLIRFFRFVTKEMNEAIRLRRKIKKLKDAKMQYGGAVKCKNYKIKIL